MEFYMTPFFSLLNQYLRHTAKSRDLEHYINRHHPMSTKEVEDLAYDYLYHSSFSRFCDHEKS